jgi:hypothetical protein
VRIIKDHGMRLVTCSCCSCIFGHGTSQVYRKVLFHFCAACWTRFRDRCNDVMARC